MFKKFLQKLFPSLYLHEATGSMLDEWVKTYVPNIPLYQQPTNDIVQVSSRHPSPIFESSVTLKIIGFKEGDDPEKVSEFAEVKPEFILDDGDRMVYLGEKRYVLPIYAKKINEFELHHVSLNGFDKEGNPSFGIGGFVKAKDEEPCG